MGSKRTVQAESEPAAPILVTEGPGTLHLAEPGSLLARIADARAEVERAEAVQANVEREAREAAEDFNETLYSSAPDPDQIAEARTARDAQPLRLVSARLAVAQARVRLYQLQAKRAAEARPAASAAWEAAQAELREAEAKARAAEAESWRVEVEVKDLDRKAADAARLVSSLQTQLRATADPSGLPVRSIWQGNGRS